MSVSDASIPTTVHPNRSTLIPLAPPRSLALGHRIQKEGPKPLIIGAPALAVLRQVRQCGRNARPYISSNTRSSMMTSTTTISTPIAVSMDTSDVLRNTVLLRLARLRPKKPRTTLLLFHVPSPANSSECKRAGAPKSPGSVGYASLRVVHVGHR